MGTISDCWHPSKLEGIIFLYVNSTTVVSKKIIKTFLIEYFSISTRCQRHRWCTLSCGYLHEFSKKFENSKRTKWCTQGLGGIWFMKKPEVKNLVHCSWKGILSFGHFIELTPILVLTTINIRENRVRLVRRLLLVSLASENWSSLYNIRYGIRFTALKLENRGGE
jgi:hypothetical protein